MELNPKLVVEGFLRLPNEEYKLKVEAWMACKRAGVEPPKELCEYFDIVNGELALCPPEDGVLVDIGEAVEVYEVDNEKMLISSDESGYVIVDVEKLRQLSGGVKYIRVYMLDCDVDREAELHERRSEAAMRGNRSRRKLSDEDVRKVFEMWGDGVSGYSQKDIATAMKVSRRTISGILRDERYKDVDVVPRSVS